MSQTIGIKRNFRDAFGRDDTYGSYCSGGYDFEPDTKKSRTEDKTIFCISTSCNVEGKSSNFLGMYRLEQRRKVDDQYDSVMRNDSLQIKQFAFHNDNSSCQPIRVFESADEIVAYFNVVAIPRSEEERRNPNINHPYCVLYRYMTENKCCGLSVAGEDHLFVFFTSPERPNIISAALVRKFHFVIDLDDTLVRSRIPKEPHDEPASEEKVFQVGPHRVYTKVLENVYPFLKWADEFFKIVFVTNSIFAYASNIVQILDPNRANFLSRVRSLCEKGLSGILKSRENLICVMSEEQNKNNDIGVSEEEKKDTYSVRDEDIDDDSDDFDDDNTTDMNIGKENLERSKKKSNKKKKKTASEKNSKRTGLLRKRNLNQEPPTGMIKNQTTTTNQHTNNCYIPPPPPATMRGKRSSSTQQTRYNKGSSTTRPHRGSRFIFIKDLETLGLPVHRSVVIDDQKHVWVRNQFNCLPFHEVNDGNGLRMTEVKEETFKKMMQISLHFALLRKKMEEELQMKRQAQHQRQ